MADPEREDADRELVVGKTADGEPYTLPVEEVLTGRAFATGKSGSGKSNTWSVIAEEFLQRRIEVADQTSEAMLDNCR